MIYYHPYLNLANETTMVESLTATFNDLKIPREEIAQALRHGYEELDNFKQDLQQKGEETLEMLMRKKMRVG